MTLLDFGGVTGFLKWTRLVGCAFRASAVSNGFGSSQAAVFLPDVLFNSQASIRPLLALGQNQRVSRAGAPARSAGSPVSFMEAVFPCALVVHLGGGAGEEEASMRGVPLLEQWRFERGLTEFM